MKNKKRYKKLKKSYRELAAHAIALEAHDEVMHSQIEDLEIDNTTLRVLNKDADAEIAKLRMLLVAWNMTPGGEELMPVEARLIEEAARIEEAVRNGEMALPVELDHLRGSVLP